MITWRDVVAIISSAFISVLIADICAVENTVKYWVIDISTLLICISIWFYIFYKIDKKKKR